MALLVSSDCFLMWVVKLELAGVDVGWMGSSIGLDRRIHQCEGVIGYNGWFCSRCYIALLLLFSKHQLFMDNCGSYLSATDSGSGKTCIKLVGAPL